jgi:uncharacterized phage infection (PIP) family protein YhgE
MGRTLVSNIRLGGQSIDEELLPGLLHCFGFSLAWVGGGYLSTWFVTLAHGLANLAEGQFTSVVVSCFDCSFLGETTEAALLICLNLIVCSNLLSTWNR